MLFSAANFATTECEIILGETFKACHREIFPDPYYEQCRFDTCACSDGENCMCYAVAHYARVCSRAGFVINWRTESFCRKCKCTLAAMLVKYAFPF